MKNSSENVVLFPKWKKMLEDKSVEAIKQKEYEEALINLNKLLSYHVNNHEIIIGKMICLMELGRYEAAQDYCEQVLKCKDANYYHYLHIYLTILFQTSQYELLMDQLTEEFINNKIPKMFHEQFKQLYDMSEQMKNDLNIKKHKAYLNDLQQAIDEDDHSLQWRLVEDLRKMEIKPTQRILHLLVDESIHPVIKTAIFLWLQDEEVTQEVSIHKLNLSLDICPVNVSDLQLNTTVKQTILMVSELEQNNPSLFLLIKQVLYRYAYVRHPIMYPNEDIIEVTRALKYIGNQYLNIHINSDDNMLNDTTVRYIEEIKMCEALYLSIIEE
ncbi:tetratricopeptide repeat protein [Virgibacillus alimentarius]|uniref:Tetratricopeptide (TPR) repeat protein n=1 Tax=Virgibacillus alimentarius TaxID=698769 RepID=A0ABS4S6I2_9BACI|nr:MULTISPECIES: tetratricopeptide repeat protein [Virgibacillus]MBP2256666.1 tetratricopeptide (TPR) repeat protein [Virgibacillus alimentarius]HLR67128.1 tetratricopeptide repeat protein [Virgibacillus sp.]